MRRESGVRLPDEIIAATALEHRFAVASRNARAFDQVRGLRMQPLSRAAAPAAARAQDATDVAERTALLRAVVLFPLDKAFIGDVCVLATGLRVEVLAIRLDVVLDL